MRLIDADALIKESYEIKLTSDEAYHCVIGREKVLELIQNAPTVERPTGEWIPVSERLPKISERVLLTLNNGEVYIGHLHTYQEGVGWTLEPTSLLYIYPSESAVA